MKTKINILFFVAIFICSGVFAFAAETPTNVPLDAAMAAPKDNIQISLHRAKGSFKLQGINEKKETYDLLESRNDGTSSFFILRVNKHYYKLNSSTAKISAEKIPSGGRLIYSIAKVADVLVDFVPYKSKVDGGIDVLRFEVTVINKGKFSASFGLKAVFDTVLGECCKRPFSTALERNITTERQFTDVNKHVFVESSDGLNTVNFILFGADATPPVVVSLGPKNIISDNDWIPPLINSRAYSNSSGKNDSAMAVNWHTAEIESGKNASVVFYVSTASGEREAAKSVDWLFPLVPEKTKDAGPTSDNLILTEKTSEAVDEAVLPTVANPPVELQNTDQVPYVEFETTKNYNEIDAVRIRELIEKIYALEKTSDINRDEILQLNKELDESLEKMRRQ